MKRPFLIYWPSQMSGLPCFKMNGSATGRQQVRSVLETYGTSNSYHQTWVAYINEKRMNKMIAELEALDVRVTLVRRRRHMAGKTHD